jgi:2,4-dienoyl-CoA reductase-like NADH-dependent reductase (Old Yellow Enzyme family)
MNQFAVELAAREQADPSRSVLFTPARIGPLTLKNRLVMPPMTTRCADVEGFVTDDLIAYYVRRAVGGVGMITVEMSSPEAVGRHRHRELGIFSDKFLPGLRRLVSALHDCDVKVSIQLGHGGGHTREDICGESPIAPSALPHVVHEGHTETIVPEEMSVARIQQTIEAFAAAAFRAQEAGFDAVEVHAAHGYLLSQFLASAENIRRDEYGGSLRNRARLALEITSAVRAAAPRLAVIFRLNAEDYFPGGVTLEDAKQVSVWAEEAGAHAVSVTAGHYRSLPSASVMIPPMALPDAPFLDYAAAVKQRLKVPVIAAGRLGVPAIAARAVEDGKADFVLLGRPLLADPGWPNRVRSGEPVRLCIACNTCVDSMRDGHPLACLVNAEVGRERRSREAVAPAGRRIAVIGGGPAGLSYASVAAAGNEITVFERSERFGGSLHHASLAPKFQSVDASPAVVARYIQSLEALCRHAGVKLKPSWSIATNGDDLRNFDLIVLAIGAEYRWAMGPAVKWSLERGLTHWPILKSLASSPRVRNWFYYKARRSRVVALERYLPVGVPVISIGDARKPGKCQQAVQSAFEAAWGNHHE